MTANLPEPVPHCEKHGPMTLRPLAEQSKETAWCGAWYDCRFAEHGHECSRSTLIPSKELRAQLDDQRAARAARVAAGANTRASRTSRES